MEDDEIYELEIDIVKSASFDNIAPIVIYLYADLKYEKEAVNALKKLKNQCKIDEVQKFLVKDLKKGNVPDIDFSYVYNQLFKSILKEYSFETYIDEYGAYGWIDNNGDKHSGDSSGYYPFYMDEETLRKNLADQ